MSTVVLETDVFQPRHKHKTENDKEHYVLVCVCIISLFMILQQDCSAELYDCLLGA